MNNAHQPAFGFVDNRSSSYEDNEVHYGLNKREYFAAMAMQAILSNPSEMGRDFKNSKIPEMANCKTDAEFVALSSVIMADNLLKQLSK